MINEIQSHVVSSRPVEAGQPAYQPPMLTIREDERCRLVIQQASRWGSPTTQPLPDAQPIWTSSRPEVADVASAGSDGACLVGRQPGRTRLTCCWGGIYGFLDVLVVASDAAVLVIQPDTPVRR